MEVGKIRESVDSRRLSHLLWEVGAYSTLLSETALASTSLTPATAGALDVIAANPGTSIAEMARRLPTSAQGVSQLVAKLEALGFVERQLGERGHGVALYVTESGEEARLEADERKRTLEEELSSALGQRDYDRLVQLLTRARPLLAGEAEAHRAAGK